MEKATLPDVLTLEETSIYLRLSIEEVTDQAVRGDLPGRKVKNGWRFLKIAIDDWLRAKNGRSSLLDQASANVVSKHPSVGEMFSQLRQLCAEENYTLDLPDRTDKDKYDIKPIC